MNRLTVISKNTKIRKIDIVVVHSFDDAYKEAQYAMERGCDEAVVEDEVHNVVLRLIKPKKTNFDRITASPEALVRWVSEITDFCDRGCSHCPVQEKCLYDSDGAGNKDNDELLLEWLNEESEE